MSVLESPRGVSETDAFDVLQKEREKLVGNLSSQQKELNDLRKQLESRRKEGNLIDAARVGPMIAEKGFELEAGEIGQDALDRSIQVNARDIDRLRAELRQTVKDGKDVLKQVAASSYEVAQKTTTEKVPIMDADCTSQGANGCHHESIMHCL